MRGKLTDIALETLNRIKGRELIKRCVNYGDGSLVIEGKIYPLNKPPRIAALGKASLDMVKGIIDMFPYRLEGIIVSPEAEEIPGFKVFQGSHPIPDKKSLKAGRSLLKFAMETEEEDTVLFLISGGASSLASLPFPPLKIEDKRKITGRLLKAGADIEEINTVRRHISGIKGGRLAKAFFPSMVITIAISDVKFDRLYDIGSGPTAPDPTKKEDAARILKKYGFSEYISTIEKFPETPKKGDEIFESSAFHIAGNTFKAVEKAMGIAEKEGIKTLILTGEDSGEARETAKLYAGIIYEIRRSGNPVTPPVLLISGGELTVTVKGQGKGGRNLEFALSMVNDLRGFPGKFSVLSIGTDGIDGTTNAAGACFDDEIYRKMKEIGISEGPFLSNNDSFSFFEKTGNLIITGPTGTNVRDLRLLYVG